MKEEKRYTKAEFLAEMDWAWTKLNAALDRMDEATMSEVRDAQGWAVKDHLTHIAAWERSMVYLLRGRPRFEGLGVDEALASSGDFDAINAIIQERRANSTPDEARAEMEREHRDLIALLEPLRDDDLYRPSSSFAPSRDNNPVIGALHGNTAGHYDEHIEWIEALVGGAPE